MKMNLQRVIILGHSSGSFVAHEFLRYIESMDPQRLLRGRIVYFNLDGGKHGLETTVILDAARYCYWVYAYDSTTSMYSPNTGAMRELGQKYNHTGKAQVLENDASNSHCEAGYPWCLHSSLVNTQPWVSNGSAPWLDYTTFTPPHVVQSAFLRVLAP